LQRYGFGVEKLRKEEQQAKDYKARERLIEDSGYKSQNSPKKQFSVGGF
jgi:hypothetical protein